VLIFPEGSVTNNKYLMPFKRGPFVAEKTVVPILLTYEVDDCLIHPFIDTLSTVQTTILTQCAVLLHKQKFRIRVKFLPPFQPNPYLFKTHEARGDERWKVFAWAVRDAMLKNSDMKEEPNNYGHEERVKFLAYLGGKSKTYELEPEAKAEAEKARTKKHN
jgi:lysophosphatidylcholine acyltransferase/lyso-PAF acetyltransferase